MRAGETHVNDYPARRRSDESSITTRADPLRALIVDDDPHFRSYIGNVTHACGFAVDEASDGDEALDRLSHRPYDLVIVDQEMPRRKGLELIGGIREADETQGLYAMMLTAYDDVDTKLAALRSGYDDFLAKSVSEAEIVAKLVAAKRVVSRHHMLDVAVRELYGLATRDELTGVLNRRLFVSETERLLAERVAVCVVLFDLDGFKQVNDTFGHMAGDRVLRDIGALFLRKTRPEDLIARYGGDEFVMLVVNLAIDDATHIAGRLSEHVRALRWTAGSASFSVGVSTGVGSSQLLAQPTVAQLLNAADRDLYTNKWLIRHPDSGPRANADLKTPR